MKAIPLRSKYTARETYAHQSKKHVNLFLQMPNQVAVGIRNDKMKRKELGPPHQVASERPRNRRFFQAPNLPRVSDATEGGEGGDIQFGIQDTRGIYRGHLP